MTGRKPSRPAKKKPKSPRTKQPMCCCLTCRKWFDQPDRHYIHLDCPACLKLKGRKRWRPAKH